MHYACNVCLDCKRENNLKKKQTKQNEVQINERNSSNEDRGSS